MSNTTPRKNLPNHLVLRSFRSEDDEDCCELELRANQHKNTKRRGLPLVGPLYGKFIDTIQVHQSHPRGFSAMAEEGADEHEIIVCQDTTWNKVAAVICCHIRTVRWSGTSLKVGFVYGLRVHEDCQRQGIGTALSDELERRCRKRGVSMLYLSVNRDNDNAKSLYERLGYKLASERAVRTKFLTSREVVSEAMVVVPIENRTAAEGLTEERYASVDGSPSSFLPLFSSPHFERMHVAVPRSELESANVLQGKSNFREAILEAIQSGKIQSYGGVSQWNGSAYKKFEVLRVVLSKEVWLSPGFRWLLASAMVTLSGWWWRSLVRRLISQPRTRWGVAFMTFEALVATITSVVLWKVYGFFRFIISRDTSRLSARAFAPFCAGPMGNDCLRAALASSKNYSQECGYGLWIMNVDKNHPDSTAFGKGGFSVCFLQKWLLEPEAAASEWKLHSPSAFCDPRDF